MKGNEERSARALAGMLARIGITCTWNPVVPANGFPDFDFNVTAPELGVEFERWAVECTDLHQYVDHGGKAVSRHGVDRKLERFCEGIQKKARPIPNRRYLITTSGPDFQIASGEVEERAIEYINSGRTGREPLDVPIISHPDPDAEAILRGRAVEDARVHIQAITTAVTIEYGTGLAGDVYNADRESPADDIKATLRYALQRILADKLPKMKQCTNYNRRLLVIWRGYWLAEVEQVRQVVAELTLDPAAVDTLLFVKPPDEIHCLADPGQLFT